MKRHWRHNSDKSHLKKTIVAVCVLLGLLLLVPKAVALVSSVVLYPIQSVQTWLTESSLAIPTLWRDKVALQHRITELEVQLSQVAPESVSQQRLQIENQRLRSLLAATTSDRIAAGVVARPNQLPFDVLQIDQGSADGVDVGAPVYVDAEQVIGMVSKTYRRSALVTLFSTPGFTGTAYIGESDVLAIIEGLGGGVVRVLVPQGIPLRVGSLVYLPGIQPGVIGRIAAVENEPTQPEQFGYIVSETPLAHVRYVSVGETTDVNTDEVSVEAYLTELQTQLLLPDIYVPTTTATSTDQSTTTTISNDTSE